MSRWFAVVILTLFLLVSGAATALAQESDDDTADSFLLRVKGQTTIDAAESIDAAVIIDGDIVVNGTVTSSLLVVNGTADISGAIGDDVVVVNGDLILRAGATVDNVTLVSSNLTQEDGATVTGEIEERSSDFSLGRGPFVLGILFWLGLLTVGLVTGALFAWLGRDQLYGAIETLRTHFVPSLVTALLLWIVLPIVAFLVIFTLIGAPIGISIIVVLLPVLWLLGAIVMGAWVGSYIVKPTSTWRAIGSTLLGIVLISLVSLIPFVSIFVGLAGMLGSGALVYRAYRRASDPSFALPAPVTA